MLHLFNKISDFCLTDLSLNYISISTSFLDECVPVLYIFFMGGQCRNQKTQSGTGINRFQIGNVVCHTVLSGPKQRLLSSNLSTMHFCAFQPEAKAYIHVCDGVQTRKGLISNLMRTNVQSGFCMKRYESLLYNMIDLLRERERSVAKFIVPDWGDKVNTSIGLSNRDRQATWAVGPTRQPYGGVNFIPRSGTMNFNQIYGPWHSEVWYL